MPSHSHCWVRTSFRWSVLRTSYPVDGHTGSLPWAVICPTLAYTFSGQDAGKKCCIWVGGSVHHRFFFFLHIGCCSRRARFMWRWTWSKVGSSHVLVATKMMNLIMNLWLFIPDFLWRFSWYPLSTLIWIREQMFYYDKFPSQEMITLFWKIWWDLLKVIVHESPVLTYTFLLFCLSIKVQPCRTVNSSSG